MATSIFHFASLLCRNKSTSFHYVNHSFLEFLVNWDYFRKHYYACPDDKTFRFMASLYSNSHRNMSLSKEFPGGITNGARWYDIIFIVEMLSGYLLHLFLYPAVFTIKVSSLAGILYMVACKIGIIYMLAVLNWLWRLVMTNGRMRLRLDLNQAVFAVKKYNIY